MEKINYNNFSFEDIKNEVLIMQMACCVKTPNRDVNVMDVIHNLVDQTIDAYYDCINGGMDRKSTMIQIEDVLIKHKKSTEKFLQENYS